MTRTATIALGAALAACSGKSLDSPAPPPTNPFVESVLVADVAGEGTSNLDANLVNPWGLAFSTTGTMWVADNHSGVSTVYDSSGTAATLVVTIPSPTAATGGAPSGILFNATADFAIPRGGASHWIFATEDGTIAAWSSGASAQIVADRSAQHAVYKGLAIDSDSGANKLYATDFHNGNVDVFNADFSYARSFRDSTMQAGFAPFGIQLVDTLLYVTYAKVLLPDSMDDQAGPGLGFVDVFNPSGTLAMRFASASQMNAPWGIAVAPASFGSFGGDVLVGNFGDGRIGAYDPASGKFAGFVEDSTSTPIAIDGLWGITFGPGSSSNKLYFAAGPGAESHGVMGIIAPKP